MLVHFPKFIGLQQKITYGAQINHSLLSAFFSPFPYLFITFASSLYLLRPPKLEGNLCVFWLQNHLEENEWLGVRERSSVLWYYDIRGCPYFLWIGQGGANPGRYIVR